MNSIFRFEMTEYVDINANLNPSGRYRRVPNILPPGKIEGIRLFDVPSFEDFSAVLSDPKLKYH